jgi:endo-1,4-beta-D-glucanase Y
MQMIDSLCNKKKDLSLIPNTTQTRMAASAREMEAWRWEDQKVKVGYIVSSKPALDI